MNHHTRGDRPCEIINLVAIEVGHGGGSRVAMDQIDRRGEAAEGGERRVGVQRVAVARQAVEQRLVLARRQLAGGVLDDTGRVRVDTRQ